MCFYEKVIKVKADVAAFLNPSFFRKMHKPFVLSICPVTTLRRF